MLCFSCGLCSLLSCAVGNSFSDDERCIVAGYDNGDIKLFDLRANAIRYETNVANGKVGSTLLATWLVAIVFYFTVLYVVY